MLFIKYGDIFLMTLPIINTRIFLFKAFLLFFSISHGQNFTSPVDSLQHIVNSYADDVPQKTPYLFEVIRLQLLSGDRYKTLESFDLLEMYDLNELEKDEYNKYLGLKAKYFRLIGDYKKALQLARSIKLSVGQDSEFDYLLLMAEIFTTAKQSDSAKIYFKKIREFTSAVPDEFLIARYELALALYYKKYYKKRLAIKNSLSAFQYFNAHQYNAFAGKALATVGHSYYLSERYDSSLYYCYAAIPYLEKNYCYQTLCSNYNVVATVLQNTGRMNKSIEFYFKGLKLAEYFRIEYLLPAFLYNLGNSHLLIKSYKKSKVYFQSCFDYALLHKDTISNLYAANALGILTLELGEIEEASEYFDYALNLARLKNAKFVYSYVFNNQADIFIHQGKYSKAKELVDSSKFWAEHYSSTEMLIPVNIRYAKLYAADGKSDDAIQLLKQSLQLCRETYYLENEICILKLLADIYKSEGRLAKALDYFEEAQNLSDSLNFSTILENLVNLEYEYEYQKNDRIKQLENEKQLLKRETQIRRSKLLSYISIAIGFVLFLILGFFVLLNRSKKKKNKILIEKNNLIEKQRNELTKTNATKDKLFSIIGHDLKNPFNVIYGYSDLLLSEDLDEESKKDFYKRINVASIQLTEMIDNLLLWSRGQLGKIKFARQVLSLDKIFEDSINSCRLMAEKKNISLEREVGKTEGLFVYADKDMLKIVLQNLICNAIKYTPVSGRVLLGCNLKGKTAIVFIRDNGLGIEDDVINLILKGNVNSSQNGTKGEKGTGLGLSICRDFLKMHKEKLKIVSEIDNGSEFSFELQITDRNQN
jgi:signal transduction histidine kinase